MNKVKLLILISFLFISISGIAQSPQVFNYQAVIRDNAGVPITNGLPVILEFEVLQGSLNGTTVHSESHSVTPNSRGLVTLQIGTGFAPNPTSFQNINWGMGTYYLKISLKLSPTSPLVHMGTNQLISVPYAMHATTADSIVGGLPFTELDPVFDTSLAKNITTTDTTYWGNHTRDTDTKLTEREVDSLVADNGYLTSFTEVDGSLTNEIQELILMGDTLGLTRSAKRVILPNSGSSSTRLDFDSLTNLPAHLDIDSTNDFSGNYSDLTNIPPDIVDGDNDTQLTEHEVDSLVANNGYLTSFIEKDSSVTNELQMLRISNDTIYLSSGGFVKLPKQNVFDSLYTSLIGAPTNVSDFINDVGYLSTYVEKDSSVINEIQQLSLKTDTLFLSKGGNSVILPSSPWSISGSNVFRPSGLVGIGTSPNSNFRLTVSGKTWITDEAHFGAKVLIDEHLYHIGDTNSFFGFTLNDNWKLNLDDKEIISTNSNTIELKTRNIRIQNVSTSSVLAIDDSLVAINSSGYLKRIPTSGLTNKVDSVSFSESSSTINMVNPGSGEANGLVSTITIDVNNVGVGAALYIKANGNYATANAGNEITMPCVALALESGTGNKRAVFYGFVNNISWNWTIGQRIYMHLNTGELTQSPPNSTGEFVQVVGFATAAQTMMFNPDMTLIELN